MFKNLVNIVSGYALVVGVYEAGRYGWTLSLTLAVYTAVTFAVAIYTVANREN